MRKRLDDVQQALQDRKLIDRAKGLLMEKRGLSEADAYAAPAGDEAGRQTGRSGATHRGHGRVAGMNT